MIPQANITAWRPFQLRHNAATELRKEFGLDAGRIIPWGESRPCRDRTPWGESASGGSNSRPPIRCHY